jgi:hypothetical protein
MGDGAGAVGPLRPVVGGQTFCFWDIYADANAPSAQTKVNTISD